MSYLIWGCGRDLCLAGGKIQWDPKKGEKPDFDAVECFMLLYFPIIPIKAFHTHHWSGNRCQSIPLKLRFSLALRAVVGRWVKGGLLACSVLSAMFLWLYVQSLDKGLQPGLNFSNYKFAIFMLILTSAFMILLLLVLLVLRLSDQRNRDIRLVCGRNEMGSSDIASWHPQVLNTLSFKPSSFGESTYAAAATTFLASCNYPNAMLAARLCVAMEDRKAGEAATNAILKHAQVRKMLPKLRKDPMLWSSLMGSADVATDSQRNREETEQSVQDSLFDHLITAIIADGDDPDTLDRVLSQAIDLNQQQWSSVTPIMRLGFGGTVYNFKTFPLIVAALHHKVNKTQLLLHRGARTNVACSLGRTPLHWAVVGKFDFANLVFYASLADQDTNENNSPMVVGAIADDLQRLSLETTRLLLENRANSSVRDHSGMSPLHLACQVGGKGEHIKLLLAHGASLTTHNANGDTPLNVAVQFGQQDAVAILLNLGADPNAANFAGQTALHWACSLPAPAIANMLLKAKANLHALDSNGVTPFSLAVHKGSAEIVLALRNFGLSDPLPVDTSIPVLLNALKVFDFSTYANWFDDVDISQPLPDGNAWLVSALQAQASPQGIAFLLSRGAAVSQPDSYGALPVHYAAALGLSEQLKVLVEYGGDKNAQDNDGRSPLIVATSQNQPDSVRALLAINADLELKTNDGWTALHQAVEYDVNLVRLLVDAGANIQSATDAGYTPLHRAALKGNADVLEYLLAAGADPYATDAGGHGLEEFAEQSNDERTISIVDAPPIPQAPANAASWIEGLPDYLELSIKKAPGLLPMLLANGTVTIAGGDGNTPETAVVIGGVSLPYGLVAIYHWLELKHGKQVREDQLSNGDSSASGWVLKTSASEEFNSRHLNVMVIQLCNGTSLSHYFDVSQWSTMDMFGTMTLLSAHGIYSKLFLQEEVG